MAMNGTDFLLLANTGTEEVPAYEVVGCQRDGSIDENTAEIDISCKNQREKRVLAGRYDSSISLESLYVPDDDAYQVLKDAMRNGDLILIARQESGVVTETATVLVATLSESFPDQDAAVVSISLTVDGAWEEVGS